MCKSQAVIAQASVPDLLANHVRSVTSTYMFPFDEDLCSFDFEVDPRDEYMCAFGPLPFLAGKIPCNEAPISERGEQADGS